MPNHSLTTRPAVAKIKHAQGTTMYSDPTIKSDPDARGVRLAVGATTKTWVLSKRIHGSHLRTMRQPNDRPRARAGVIRRRLLHPA